MPRTIIINDAPLGGFVISDEHGRAVAGLTNREHLLIYISAAFAEHEPAVAHEPAAADMPRLVREQSEHHANGKGDKGVLASLGDRVTGRGR